ncbi:hypothetical protein BGZ76_008789 [Entomortierella beljakovae]|nr:hypothetical protein BGZ76_008789 [Entomortierella beljakovae]
MLVQGVLNSSKQSNPNPDLKFTSLTNLKALLKSNKPKSKSKTKTKSKSKSDPKPIYTYEGRGWTVSETADFEKPKSSTHAEALKDLLLALPRDKDKDQFNFYCYVVRLDDCNSTDHVDFWSSFSLIFAGNEEKFVLIVTGCSNEKPIIENTCDIQKTFGIVSIVFCDFGTDANQVASLKILEGQLKDFSLGRPLLSQPIKPPGQDSDGSARQSPFKRDMKYLKEIFSSPKEQFPQRRILLVGKRGSGKSTIGNMLTQGKLLEHNTFAIQANMMNPSSHVEAYYGRTWEVCEASGLCEFGKDNQKEAGAHLRLIKQTQQITKGGYHYFAYVVNAEDFSVHSHQESFKFFKTMFDSCRGNFVVIFTHCNKDWISQNISEVHKAFGDIPKLYCDFPFNKTNPKTGKRDRTASRKQLETGLMKCEFTPRVPSFNKMQKDLLTENEVRILGNVAAHLVFALVDILF